MPSFFILVKLIINASCSQTSNPMKLLKFFSILFSVLSILIGFGPVLRDTSLIEKIDEQMSLLNALPAGLGQLAFEHSGMPSKNTLYFGLFLVFFLMIMCLIALIMLIRKDKRLSVIALVIIGVAALSIIIHPDVQVSENGGATPRLAAMLQAIPAALEGICMYLYMRMRQR